MVSKKKLPIGVDIFEKLIRQDFYYVDKTVPESRTGVVIELKYARNGHLDAACAEALGQIEEKKYEAKLQNDGMQTIVKYGIACYKKRCSVAVNVIM